MHDIVWYNIPDLLSPLDTIKDPYYKSLRILMQEKQPTSCILYFKNGKINFLENLVHTKKAVNFLNKHSLHIFLYEPLCMHISGQDRKSFTEEIPKDYPEEHLLSDELESIKSYVIRNNLSNVVVHTGDYTVESHFKKYSPYIKLICDDIFLKHFVVFKTQVAESVDFKRKFLCLNWRYTNHRQLIASYMLDVDSKITWFFKQTYRELKENLWFDIEKWNLKTQQTIEKNLEILNLRSPLTLDLQESANNTKDTMYPSIVNPVSKNTKNEMLDNEYFNSFCIIVTESRYAQPTANYSEKVLEAIRHRRPFVLVAPPYTLKYLKSKGFKTFGLFWDETYDNIENHEDRMLKIFKVIDFINSKSLDDINEIYKKMEPILKHNYRNLVSISPTKSIQEV